jgi:uncharacterized membrane protein
VGSGNKVKLQAQRDHHHDKESGLTRERLQSVVSQQEIVLPDAAELAEYHKLDPTIVTWLMEHAAKEQNFRHQSHDRKLVIREKNAATDRELSGWGMLCGFLIFMGGMALSGLLVYMGHSIAGPLFAGATLIGGASIFVTRVSADNKAKPATAVAVQDPPA